MEYTESALSERNKDPHQREMRPILSIVHILMRQDNWFIFELMLAISSRPRLDLDDPRTSSTAKKAFFRIAELWGLSNDHARVLLGVPSRTTFFAWKKGEGGTLPRDVLERISYVIGIYKALQILFSDPAQADAWMSKPNAAFGGRSALERMVAGNVGDLHAVRAYLDHVRGGGS